ncbi:MAG: hypothetical protein HY606_03905 [Planctomycetes bacterium]|nr:hypothetical protein [Planctomycetota bacterium]
MSKENKSMSNKDIIGRLIEARAILDDCVKVLLKVGVQKARTSPKKVSDQKLTREAKLDFGLNERNFIKIHAKGLSGPKKFTLLLAFMAKGKVGTDIALDSLRFKWGKMTSKNLMEYEFNRKYSTEAKTQGWVDSKKSSFYYLTNRWMNIFN